MNNLQIKNETGVLTIDSRDVAEMTGKRHSDLLESIEVYIKHLENGNFRSQDFFIESTYTTEGNNKNYKCYLLTKKGCDMVANKMTGEKGILFTATYVTRFEEMEQQIKQPTKLLSPMELLEMQYKVIKDHDEKILNVSNEVKDIKSNIVDIQSNSPLFTVECKELQSLVKKIGTKSLGGYRSPAYSNHSLRGKVYSDIQHQLRREFGVERYEAIKRCQLDKARELIENYKTPLILNEEITLVNSQIRLIAEVV